MHRFSVATMILPFLLLTGCASAVGSGGRTLGAGGQATLSAGESVTLPDASTLTYVGVTSDSRCPPNVQCIQAGEATVAFRHTMGSASHDVELKSRTATTADLGDWRLTLVGLTFDAPPKATVRLDAAR